MLTEHYAYQVAYVPKAGLIHWDEHRAPYTDPRQLSQSPLEENAGYGDPSPGLSDSKRMTALKREIVDYIYKTDAIVIPHNPELDLYGQPGMNRRDFLIQAQSIARQERDREIDKVAAQYDKKFDQLEAKLRKTARQLDGERKQLESAKNESLFTTGEAMLSLLRGRTTYTLSRMSRANRYKGYVEEDIYEHEAVIDELEQQLQELEYQMQDELARINAKWGNSASQVEEYRITPYKKDIYLGIFGVGWRPNWLVKVNGNPMLVPAWENLPPSAYQEPPQLPSRSDADIFQNRYPDDRNWR
jgi:hypothetical protein